MQVEEIKRVAVVGMGIMGPDIALACAFRGYRVAALDRRQASLEKAQRRLEANIRIWLEQGILDQEKADDVTSRIDFTLDWEEAMGRAQYVTEAVPENLDAKRDVFRRCGELCGKETVVASNTSSMSIDEIASEMKFPERAVVTHWFIPAHLMPVVEVVPGKNTAASTTSLACAFLSDIDKRPVVCKDNPGFIQNYIQAAMFRAALTLVEKGVCSAKDVDTVVQNGFALRLASIGPIRMADYAGLDTCLNLFRYVYGKTDDPGFKPPGILEEMVAKGELGMKTGKGFYDYSPEEVEQIRKEADLTVLEIKKVKDNLKKARTEI